jgi:hypothetical protein
LHKLKGQMNSQFDIFYEVVHPGTQKTEFVTEDRYMAEILYEKGYTVFENHMTITKQTKFKLTKTYSIFQWNDYTESEET